jgi:hypothetical protein
VNILRTKKSTFVRTLEADARERPACSSGRLHPTPGRTVRLYDVTKDAGEFHNVAPEHPDVVAQLQNIALERFRKTHPEAASEPAGGSREDKLEFYLRPRDL